MSFLKLNDQLLNLSNIDAIRCGETQKDDKSPISYAIFFVFLNYETTLDFPTKEKRDETFNSICKGILGSPETFKKVEKDS